MEQAELNGTVQKWLEALSQLQPQQNQKYEQAFGVVTQEGCQDLNSVLEMLGTGLKLTGPVKTSLHAGGTHLAVTSRSLAAYLTVALEQRDTDSLAGLVHAYVMKYLLQLMGVDDPDNTMACMFHDDIREGVTRVVQMSLLRSYDKVAIEGLLAVATKPPVIYVGARGEVSLLYHACARVGLPLSSVSIIPCSTADSANHAIDVVALEKQINDDCNQGKTPLLVVAYAGTPIAGHVEDLVSLRHICDKYNMWLHVTGHGLSSMFLPDEREELKGVTSADSFTLFPGVWFGILTSPSVTFHKHPKVIQTNGVPTSVNFPGEKAQLADREFPIPQTSWTGLYPHGLNKLLPLSLWVSLQYLGSGAFVDTVSYCRNLIKNMIARLDQIPGITRIAVPDHTSYVVLFKYHGGAHIIIPPNYKSLIRPKQSPPAIDTADTADTNTDSSNADTNDTGDVANSAADAGNTSETVPSNDATTELADSAMDSANTATDSSNTATDQTNTATDPTNTDADPNNTETEPTNTDTDQNNTDPTTQDDSCNNDTSQQEEPKQEESEQEVKQEEEDSTPLTITIRGMSQTITNAYNIMISKDLQPYFPKVGIATYDLGGRDGVIFRFDPINSFPEHSTSVEDIEKFIVELQKKVNSLHSIALARCLFDIALRERTNLRWLDFPGIHCVAVIQYVPSDWATKQELTVDEVNLLNQHNLELSKQLSQGCPVFTMFQHGNFTCILIKELPNDKDMFELLSYLLEQTQVYEEHKKYLEGIKEKILEGIEKAKTDLTKEKEQKEQEQGFLQYVPIVGSVVGWLYPTSPTTVSGRTFNLTSGKVETSSNVYKHRMQLVNADDNSKNMVMSPASVPTTPVKPPEQGIDVLNSSTAEQ